MAVKVKQEKQISNKDIVQSGFARDNYVQNKNSTRGLLWFSIFAMLLLLYLAWIISTNLILKKNGFLIGETLQWFSPNEIFSVMHGLWFRDNVIKTELVIFYLAPFSVLFVISALVIRAAQSSMKSSVPSGNRHGTARFATEKEIYDSKLVVTDIAAMIKSGESGVSLGMAEVGKPGKKKLVYLIERTQNEHVLCYAPSRSGKGVGLVIPSLLMWQDSSITLDPKGENWEKTSGALTERGVKCIRLDLGAPYFRYNPLSELKPNDVDLPDEVRRMIGVITSTGGSGGNENKYFEDQAKDLLTVCITYLVITYDDPIPGTVEEKIINESKKTKPNITLYDLAIFLSGIDPRTGVAYAPDPSVPKDTALARQYREIANYQTDYIHHMFTKKETYKLVGEFIESSARKFLALTATEKTFLSVSSTADQNLAIFKLPIIRAITQVSDFKLHDLVDPLGPPTALFLVNPPKDELTGKTDGLIKIVLQNLFISVLYETGLRAKTTENKYGWNKRAVLCMLDEFPKLGKFEIMEKLLADAAGYGAKFYLISQSDKQINKAYEKENAIFAGCQHKVMFRPADSDTAEALSKILGNYTYVEQKFNVKDGDTGKIDILKPKSGDKSWDESSRALMTQDEILSMKDNEAIILSKSYKIFGRKLTYYTDPCLSALSKIKEPYVELKMLSEDDESFKFKMKNRGISEEQFEKARLAVEKRDKMQNNIIDNEKPPNPDDEI